MATTTTEAVPATQNTETPSAFVERTGFSKDRAWRAWNEMEDRERLSRDAFRQAVAEGR